MRPVDYARHFRLLPGQQRRPKAAIKIGGVVFVAPNPVGRQFRQMLPDVRRQLRIVPARVGVVAGFLAEALPDGRGVDRRRVGQPQEHRRHRQQRQRAFQIA